MAISDYRPEIGGTGRRIRGFAAALVLGLVTVCPPAGGNESLPSDGTPSRGVLVAGSGDVTPKVERALDEIVNHLLGLGVQASRPQNWMAPLDELAPVARESGAHSMLILNITFGYLEKIRADCYLTDGTLLWTEKFSGPFGVSFTGVRVRLVTRMKSRLEKRVGDSCLPKSP